MTRLYCCDSEPTVKVRENRKRKRFVARCDLCGLEEESVHGRHWKAFTKTHRDPADGAGDGAGADRPRATRKRAGTGAGKSVLDVTDVLNAMDALRKMSPPLWQQNIVNWIKYPPLSLPPTRYNKKHNIPVQCQTYNFVTTSLFVPGTIYEVLPEPKLEVCAPEVGEIVAWRIWRYVGGKLMAIVAGVVWEPNEAMKGDIDKAHPYMISQVSLRHIRLGIYAHKEQLSAMQHAHDEHKWDQFRHRREDVIVLGRVKLWGEVVEHETGYRAQYARVLSLDEVLYGECDLASLRKLYQVEPHDTQAAP